MRTKLATLFVLLASLRCYHGCLLRKRAHLGCNLGSIGSATKGVMGSIMAMHNSKQDNEPHIKLLKKFREPCKKKGVTLPVVIDILDIYKTHVFSKLNNNERFMVPVIKVKDTLEHCLDKLQANQHSKNKWTTKNARSQENIKKLTKTFEKLDNTDLYKAVIEFKTVLLWLRMFQGMDERSG